MHTSHVRSSAVVKRAQYVRVCDERQQRRQPQERARAAKASDLFSRLVLRLESVVVVVVVVVVEWRRAWRSRPSTRLVGLPNETESQATCCCCCWRLGELATCCTARATAPFVAEANEQQDTNTVSSINQSINQPRAAALVCVRVRVERRLLRGTRLTAAQKTSVASRKKCRLCERDASCSAMHDIAASHSRETLLSETSERAREKKPSANTSRDHRPQAKARVVAVCVCVCGLTRFWLGFG